MASGRALALGLLLAACRGPITVPALNFPGTLERAAGGLTIATQVDRATPAVAIVSVVRAGMSNDPPGQEGLAHLVEHLAHRRRAADGTTWRTHTTAAGAEYQGMTSDGETVYFVLVPVTAAALTLQREAERLADPLAAIDESTFERERRVVLDEHRLRGHRPGRWHLLPCVAAALYPGNPEYTAREASEESLQRLTLADAQRFADLHYRPSRTTVLLAGDLSQDAASTFSRAYAQAAAALPAPPQEARDRTRTAAPNPCQSPPPWQPEIWAAWKLPPASPRTLATQLLAEAWLDAQLQGLRSVRYLDVQHVDVRVRPGRSGSVMVAKLTLSPGVSANSSLLTSRHVREAARQRTGQLDLGDVRANRALSYGSEFEDLGHRSLISGWWMGWMGGGPGDYQRAHEQSFSTVTDADLDRFIAAYLQPEQARVWGTSPGKEPPPLSASVIGSLVSPPEEDGRAPAGTLASSLASDSSARPATAGPTAVLPGRFPYQTERRRLDNGLTVLAVRRPGSATASATLGFRGGHAFGPSGVALAAVYAHRPVLWRETGLDYSMDVDASTTRVSILALGGDVDRALDWLADEVSINGDTMFQYGPQWPPDDLESRIMPTLISHERHLYVRLSRAFDAAVFEGHRYGQRPRSEQLRDVTRQQLTDWLAGLRQPANALLVVVSGDEPRRALDRAARSFGSWQGSGAPPAAPQPLPDLRGSQVRSPAPALVYVPAPHSKHARLSLGCRLPAASLREAARAHLLAWLIEADFWNEVREAHGHSYGFSANYENERGTTVAALTAEIPVTLLAQVLAKLRQRWRSWAEQGFEPDQLAVVRSGAAAHTVLDGSTAGTLSDRLADWWARGRSLEELETWPATLAALEADEMSAAAALCRTNLVLAIAADRGLAEAAVKAGWQE